MGVFASKKWIVLLLAIAPAGACIAAAASSQELAKLEAADQADRSAGSNAIDWDIVGKHDAERRARVTVLLQNGSVRTAEDYVNAAMIFQHGDAVEDSRLALALATVASRVDASNQDAKTLAAQAWDRILVKSGKPQWYGTQFAKDKASGKWVLSPTDPMAVTEDQRTAMGLPTLAQTQAHLDALNARK